MPRRDNFWDIWEPENLAKVPEHHKERLEKEWNFRKVCFERDDFTCQKCGFKEPEESIYEKGMIVTVHHVIAQEFCERDIHEYLKYERNNGITFCEPCHKKWHKGRFKFDWQAGKWFVYDVTEKINLDKIDMLIKLLKVGG